MNRRKVSHELFPRNGIVRADLNRLDSSQNASGSHCCALTRCLHGRVSDRAEQRREHHDPHRLKDSSSGGWMLPVRDR